MPPGLGRSAAVARHHIPEASGALTRAQIVSSLIQSFAPVGWWSMRATSGTNEPNRGSAGSAADMAITSATLGQTGQLGGNEAALMDGAASRYQTPNNAALASLTTWEYVFLINPSSAGEGNAGRFFSWGTGAQEPFFQINGATTSIKAFVYNTTPTAFIATTTTGITTSAWQLIFVSYADGGDRKLHIYRGISGAVAEYSYSAQTALTGTYQTITSVLNLFNNTAQSATIAGLADEAFVVSGNLSAAQRTALTVACGV